MKKVLVFLLLIFIAKINYAQSDSSKLSPGMIEYVRPGFFRAGKFIVNGKQESWGQINMRLINDPASAAEFNQYRKYRDLTLYMFSAAVASFIASAIVAGNSNTFKTTSSKILYGVGVGFIIPEAIFAGKRNRRYRRALNLYNQQFQ